MTEQPPRIATDGDIVRIHYTGRLDDGTVFDSSDGREPLEFTVGGGKVIVGFDYGVRGMTEGEEKTVRIPADQAYGERDDERIMQIPRGQVPDEITPEIGMHLQIGLPTGGAIPATIVSMDETSITLDANHALAGKALTFDLELIELTKKGDESTD
mgnify:CR=1 FL=1